MKSIHFFFVIFFYSTMKTVFPQKPSSRELERMLDRVEKDIKLINVGTIILVSPYLNTYLYGVGNPPDDDIMYVDTVEKSTKFLPAASNEPIEHRSNQCIWINGKQVDPKCGEVQKKNTLDQNDYERMERGIKFYKYQGRQRLSENSKENTNASPDEDGADLETNGADHQLVSERNYYKDRADNLIQEMKEDAGSNGEDAAGPKGEVVSERNYYKSRADKLIQEMKGEDAGPNSEGAGDGDQLVSERNYYKSRADGLIQELKGTGGHVVSDENRLRSKKSKRAHAKLRSRRRGAGRPLRRSYHQLD